MTVINRMPRTSPALHDFERVDIFLRVKGRLPTEPGDTLTQEILDEYCARYRAGTLTKGIVPLEYMYDLIQMGDIKATPEKP